jgi:outer membrane protein OmpA-like peptidoglycan-associated protein
MKPRWLFPAFTALAVCSNAAWAQKAGHIELGVMPRYSWMGADRDTDDAIGIGGALAVYLSNRFKITADAAYHPTQFQDTGADVSYVPLHFGFAYEQPITSKVRAVAGARFTYISRPEEATDDTGGGLSAGLKIGLTKKLSFVTELAADVLPPFMNPRRYIFERPVTQAIILHHRNDGYLALGAGLSLRIGRDGATLPPPIVITEPPRPNPGQVMSASSDSTVKSSAPPPPPPPVTTPAAQPAPPARTVELEAVYFDFDRAALRPDAVAALDRISAILRANPGSIILIEGHTDERGPDAYNDLLGERRAAAARAFLLKHGLDTSRLRTVSRGEKDPAIRDKTDDAYAHNRRVEFRLQSGGPCGRPATDAPLRPMQSGDTLRRRRHFVLRDHWCLVLCSH